MQKIKKIHGVDPEKNASQTNGQKDGQMNRKNQWQIFKKKNCFGVIFAPAFKCQRYRLAVKPKLIQSIS